MPAHTPKTEKPAGTAQPATAGPDVPMALNPVAIQAWMDIGTEASRFVWDRLQQDIATQKALMACTNLDDMRNIQADFLASVQKQYAAQAGKMLDMLGKATNAGIAVTAKGRRYDDLPF